MSKSKSNTGKTTKLNTRQEKFCEFIVAGENQTDAYLKAGYKVTRDVARKNATRMMTNDDIIAHIAKLRKPQTEKALLTRDRKRELLAEIAEDRAAAKADRIRAMAEDSRMEGHYEPDKLQLDATPAVLNSIRERAQYVAGCLSIAKPEHLAPHVPDAAPQTQPEEEEA